ERREIQARDLILCWELCCDCPKNSSVKLHGRNGIRNSEQNLQLAQIRISRPSAQPGPRESHPEAHILSDYQRKSRRRRVHRGTTRPQRDHPVSHLAYRWLDQAPPLRSWWLPHSPPSKRQPPDQQVGDP
ncbi:hypothetical protein Tsubulata_022557, partial [Turnera subulata]